MKRKGTLFIISSPSGAGKTTIANFLVAQDGNIKRSISFTTRKPRKNEKHGLDYYFVDIDQFHKLVKEERMLEYACVLQNYYGTSREYVENTLEAGLDVLCCIDWQGADQIRKNICSTSIFILPPSLDELRRRLTGRGTDTEEVIEYRLKEALEEIKHFSKYDYVIINDDLQSAQLKVLSIVRAEREKLRGNKAQIEKFVAALTN